LIVVVDTTELFNDLRLAGPIFSILRTYIHKTGSSLVIPQVVFEEAVNHFRLRLRSEVDAYKRCTANMEKLTGISTFEKNALAIDQAGEVTQFRSYLLSQIKSFGGRVIGIDSISVACLLERSLKRRKPFDDKGQNGFRDSMLWESVLRDVIQPGPADIKVALVTKNSNDFGKSGKLEEDLECDCVDVGKPRHCVQVYNGLQQFIDVEAMPHLEKLDDIRKCLDEGKYKRFSPAHFYSQKFDYFQDRVRYLLSRYDFESLTARQTRERFHRPELHHLSKEADSASVTDVWGLEGEQLVIDILFEVTGSIECCHERRGYWPSGDEVFEESFDDDFCGDVSFSVYVTFVVDQETGDVVTWEADFLEISLASGWPFSEP
jgi:hypothetical protein